MCGHHRHRAHGARRDVAAGVPEREVRLVADDKRASDRERETAISDLRVHAGEGRLSLEELDERIAAALTATTRADLAPLTADLPGRPRDRRPERREHVRAYLAAMVLLVAIWALTGAGYFWPIWPILGWGIAVVPDALSLRRGRPQLN